MRSGQAFLLVYSITDPSSFQDCEEIHEQLLRSMDKDDVPLVLCGNKCDLEEERGVSKQEGESLAEQFNAKFFEASAKARINVDECFHTLVRLIDQQKNQESNDGDDDDRKGRSKKKKSCTLL